ncbi:diguanylate cyclase [Caenispirillum salinarum]|uniref:diguanylate cyclase n=1 Tax=Caenispirillum salinarum TaxID=859058 RepID=UPI003850CAF0
MKVLIVDDMLPNAMLLQALLADLPDVEARVVESGAQALEACRDQAPDLVVTDYVMPGMDGVELVRALREARPGDFIPVLMVTADDQKQVLYQAFEAGATDFLRKPLDEVELRARVRNMLALRRQHLDLERLATTDTLTGALNRRAFMARLETETQRAGRHGHDFAVLMLDIDHFKRINDTRGHAAGDQALVAFADTLRGHLRDTDSLGRLGGEEFAVLLPETGADGAATLAERLRAAVAAARVTTDAATFGFTTSAGLASFAGDTPESLLRRADGALYRAKEGGRDRVVAAA